MNPIDYDSNPGPGHYEIKSTLTKNNFTFKKRSRNVFEEFARNNQNTDRHCFDDPYKREENSCYISIGTSVK